jgi:hypothetical protein
MVIPANLSGQRFHKLKARMPMASNKRGRRLWLCDCDCGGTTTATSDELRSGHKKSCGCLHRQNGRRTRFTKTKALAAYAKAQRQKHDGEWWLSPRRADRYLGVNRSTRLLWQKSCHWLGGRGIRTLPLIDGFKREVDFCAEKDLVEIRENRSGTLPCPHLPDHTHVDGVCKKLSISPETLQVRMRAAGVKSVRNPGKSKDARARSRWYVPDWFVNKLADELKPDPTPKMSVREVADELDITIAAVYSAIRRNLLKAIRGKPRCKGGYKRKGPIIAPDEVERYRAYRARETEMPSAARITSPETEAPQVKKRGRGRQKGWRKQAAIERDEAMRHDWRQGKYQTASELGRAHGVDPSYARKLVRDMEGAGK